MTHGLPGRRSSTPFRDAGAAHDRATIVFSHGGAPKPVSSPVRAAGREELVDMVTAVLIDAKLELVDERRIAQSEVMT